MILYHLTKNPRVMLFLPASKKVLSLSGSALGCVHNDTWLVLVCWVVRGQDSYHGLQQPASVAEPLLPGSFCFLSLYSSWTPAVGDKSLGCFFYSPDSLCLLSSVLLARVCFTTNSRRKNYMLEKYRQHMFNNLNQLEIALSDDPVKLFWHGRLAVKASF